MTSSENEVEQHRRTIIAELTLGNANPEASLDDLVSLAALVCKAPMAAFTVLDGERQWFKARVGLSDESAPRVGAFCNHTIAQGGLFEVEDLDAEASFTEHPLVTGAPFLRFYAGVPVGLADAPAVGALCVLDHRARRLNPAEREALSALGRQLVVQLELRQRMTRERVARISAQEQLLRADRLATVGRLAAGMAHEVGTPLAIVTGRARTLATTVMSTVDVQKSAAIVVEQSERIAHFIRQLLDFARRREPRKARYDLSVIARQAVALLLPMATARGVRLTWRETGKLLAAEVDAAQLGQVITNLIVNALHATPRGGDVEVSGRDTASAVCLVVADSGGGIASEHLARVFEPFFTTKETGEGTGLGLSVAADIVRDHGGWLSVESEAGHGAIFTVQLPR